MPTALIGAAITGGVSLLGSKLGKPKTPELSAEAKQAQQGLLANQQTGQQYASQINPYMTGFYGQAQQGIQAPMDYYAKLLSGDKAAMAEAIAPEAQRIGSNYAMASNTARTVMPRGGYASTTMANLPFRQAGEINTLLQTLRPGAAAAMGTLGLGAGQLGSQAGSNMIQALAGSTQAGQGVLGTGVQQQGNLLQNQQYQQQQMYQQGMGIGNLLSGIDWSKIFKGSSAAGGTGFSTSGNGPGE
jgi:hypothetical protein